MYDPFKILGIEVDTPPRKIKEAFKKTVLKYHPDRQGGDKRKFEMVKQAYEDIKQMIKNEQQNMNMVNRTKSDYIKERDAIQRVSLPPAEVERMRKAMASNPSAFHEMFEATKVKKESDKGYSGEEVFNLIKKKQDKYNKNLQVRKAVFDPQGVNTDLKFMYEEIGVDQKNNHNSEYLYSDFVDAVDGFIDRDVANIPMPEHRLNEFKNVDEYMAFSNQQKDKKATPEELKYYKLQEQKRKREEALRKINESKRAEQEIKSTMSFSRFLELKSQGKL